jgi:hypothetical protein
MRYNVRNLLPIYKLSRLRRLVSSAVPLCELQVVVIVTDLCKVMGYCSQTILKVKNGQLPLWLVNGHVMNTYGGMEVWFHALVCNLGEVSGQLYTREEGPQYP